MKHTTTLQKFLKQASLLFLAGFIASLFTGCNTMDPSQYETVKMPPAMLYQNQQGKARFATYSTSLGSEQAPAASSTNISAPETNVSMYGKRQTISRAQIMTELRDGGLYVLPTVNDYNYIVPSYDWIKNTFSGYFNWYLYYLGARYNAEGMDCDNFANFYQQNMVLANLKAGGAKQGDVPCATIIVNQRDKGIHHALNLVRTNRGWFVVEPQDSTIVALNSYKYRGDIRKVTF